MARRTLEERIAAAQKKIESEQNHLDKLLKEHKEKEDRARTHRLCRRMGLIESMLPELKTMTDEQFEKFVKMTTANNFGREKLTAIVQPKDEKPVIVPSKRNDETADTQIEIAENVGGVSAPSAEIVDTQGV
ncbi:MAG: DUF3847 domain-containing protein [Oscillospiraceae bacterium]|nr:DUF3847 domain-containing protein [Oscillospiraceae bacterium]